MITLDRDLIFEICENLVCNPESLLADLSDREPGDSPLDESIFNHFTMEDGTPGVANPFRVFLVSRKCAHSVMDLFYKLPVLSIYSSYGSFEATKENNENHKTLSPSSNHDPTHLYVNLDHPTLQYVLKNSQCRILELHVWGTVIPVLKEIQTNTIQWIRWGFIEGRETRGLLSEDLVVEFDRILCENSRSLQNLIVDECLIPYVPFDALMLDSFTVPFFTGTLDQPFLQHINTKSLFLREAANACHIFSHKIYDEGCITNNHVKNLTIDFSRTLHDEFRKKLNLCELIMELPMRFPSLEKFKFVAEQDALLEDHFNRMICLREFGQAIYNIEEIMEGFEPCPFEFIVDVFCFVPRAALQFMVTQVFFGYQEADLLPEDKTRYVFKRLVKYFGKDNPRVMFIRLC